MKLVVILYGLSLACCAIAIGSSEWSGASLGAAWFLVIGAYVASRRA